MCLRRILSTKEKEKLRGKYLRKERGHNLGFKMFYFSKNRNIFPYFKREDNFRNRLPYNTWLNEVDYRQSYLSKKTSHVLSGERSYKRYLIGWHIYLLDSEQQEKFLKSKDYYGRAVYLEVYYRNILEIGIEKGSYPCRGKKNCLKEDFLNIVVAKELYIPSEQENLIKRL